MTGDLLLDWSKFQRGPVSPAKAFEAFSAQLFERWVRREYRDNLRFYALHGAGGDGGVEAFATLADGSVIGLQAKWFPENLDASRIKQIWGSITTAMTRYPNLVRYVVTMPCNLTPAGPAPKHGVKKGRPPKGGVERWQELIDRVTAAYPGLALERWDEQGLRGQLDLAANHELYAAWFSGTFLSISDLHLAWEKARGRLRDRYLPDLHATGAIEETLASDLFEPSWVHSARCAVADARAQFTKALNTVEDLRLHLALQADSDFAQELQDASTVLRAWCIHADLLDAALRRGPMGEIPDAPDAKPLWILADTVEAERGKALGWHASELMRAPLQRAIKSVTAMREVHDAWIAACQPRAVIGPPGCGKTHAGAHAVSMQLSSGTPAMFVAARFVDLSQGLSRVLQEVLDRPGWSLRQLLDGLEALAVLRQCTDETAEQPSPFKRTLLVLDGLEESVGWQQWEPLMADLAVECKRRPRLRLLLTMRPETARLLNVPDEFTVQYVHEDADIALPELFRRYCKHYKVNAHEVPWLSWAVRTPLEIRLIAEEFCGRTLTHDDGLRANVMGLFQRKLRRMEDETHTAAGVKAWSTGLPLLMTVLSAIVDLTRDLRPPMVGDHDIIQLVKEKDDEFTAERIRFALQRLVSHGLVDEWQPASRALIPAWPVYGVATHHLSDFVMAQSAVTNVLPLLRGGQRPSYPGSFVARPEAAILFAALLAEEGYFVTDDIWADETRPAHVTIDLLSALALVAPHVAQARRDWVQQVLLESTKGNREALRRVVVPIARLPHHPLGPPLLDEALQSLPLAERDQIWSVPDDLSGTGPWQGWADEILDEIDLDTEGDPWDGRPLVLAWSCSSVVEARRRRARALLAVWGIRRLGDMVCLLDHMARVDDPQIVEDVVVAALGAVSVAPFNDEALISLAMTVDRLFFCDDAEAWTPDVIVHIAARGIVERVAFLCPGAVDHLLKRARPPYEPRGPQWPELDVDEARAFSTFGGKVVWGDLSWYVADHCFSLFHRERREHPVEQGEDILASVDKGVIEAVLAGQFAMPEEVVQRCRAMVEQWNQRTQPFEIASANLLPALRELYAQEGTEQGEPLDTLDETDLLRWAIERHGGENVPHERKPQWSDELRALYAHASQVAGVANIAPDAVRNALIAAKVRSWGWSEVGFCCYEWDKFSQRVDQAIGKRHGAGASHGSRSAVATFREKYVWAAVNCVAGELADRLPVWDDISSSWCRLDRLGQLGTGMPDPLPRSAPDSSPASATEYPLWIPGELWPELFADEVLVSRAELWLSEAPLPNPRVFMRSRIESWPDAAVLAASLFRRGHQGCIDQAVWVATIGVPIAVVELFKRDLPHRGFARLHKEFVGLGDAGYTSPALACWAPWLTREGEAQTYISLDHTGQPVEVTQYPLVASVMTWDEDEHPREPNTWSPAPVLRSTLGIVGAIGDRHLRQCIDRSYRPVAIERDVPHEEWSFDHHYLVIDFHAFADACATVGLVPMWVVRLWREATPALRMKGYDFNIPEGLVHRSRDTHWLLSWNERANDFDVVTLQDVLEPWVLEQDDGKQR